MKGVLTKFRAPQLSVVAGLLAIALLGACKSDGVSPDPTTDAIPNPRGPLNLGDVISLNVNGTVSCSSPVIHAAKVVAIGTHAIILNDTLNPKNGFTTADYIRYAARFDTLVYPLDVANFGEPTDIDKNGHIAILFTRAVNELTPARSTSYVGGFAFSRDLFPTTKTARAQACATSNEGEFFYMLAPDPSGTINQNVRTTGFVDSVTTAVLAHEFQHIINSSRRLYVNNTPAFEDKWLDEGLAHVAEELLFYRESGLTPRSNLDINSLRATSNIRVAYNNDMSGNASRYKTYLERTATNSPYSPDDSLPTRGAAWSLLRYSVDRLNATDGFAAGPGQVVAGAGTATVSAGATSGEYSLIVVNTSVQSGTSAHFTLTTSAGPVADRSPVAPTVFHAVAAPMAAKVLASGPQQDMGFESRLRDRERADLTPLMGAARRWYATANVRSPSVRQSRALLSTNSFAGTDADIWFKLVNNQSSGIANLTSVVTDLPGFIRDWNVSHAVDDVAAPATQYQQRSWNWHSIFPGLTTPPSVYPLFIQSLNTASVADGSVAAGGAAYYKIQVAANTSESFTLNTGATPVASTQLVIVRTR
jgi:Peptidase M30.